MRNWLLPEFIEDVMPAEAGRIESLRRQLLDLFKVHGYQYVIPPTLEYVESLITGTGSKLDTATFKVVDQLTGRMMGIRADTTPQAARIDAHMLNHQGVSRLCYAGTVLRTNPSGLARTREPFVEIPEVEETYLLKHVSLITAARKKKLQLLSCRADNVFPQQTKLPV